MPPKKEDSKQASKAPYTEAASESKFFHLSKDFFVPFQGGIAVLAANANFADVGFPPPQSSRLSLQNFIHAHGALAFVNQPIPLKAQVIVLCSAVDSKIWDSAMRLLSESEKRWLHQSIKTGILKPLRPYTLTEERIALRVRDAQTFSEWLNDLKLWGHSLPSAWHATVGGYFLLPLRVIFARCLNDQPVNSSTQSTLVRTYGDMFNRASKASFVSRSLAFWSATVFVEIMLDIKCKPDELSEKWRFLSRLLCSLIDGQPPTTIEPFNPRDQDSVRSLALAYANMLDVFRVEPSTPTERQLWEREVQDVETMCKDRGFQGSLRELLDFARQLGGEDAESPWSGLEGEGELGGDQLDLNEELPGHLEESRALSVEKMISDELTRLASESDSNADHVSDVEKLALASVFNDKFPLERVMEALRESSVYPYSNKKRKAMEEDVVVASGGEARRRLLKACYVHFCSRR